MGFYFDFPQTDMNQSNLEWVMQQASDLHEIAKTFEQSAAATADAAERAVSAAAAADETVSTVTATANEALQTAQSAATEADALSARVDTIEDTISQLHIVFPIGYTVFLSNDMDPNATWAGTWQRIAEGEFIVGSDSTHAAGTSYGSNSRTVSADITVGEHALTIAEMPAHAHPGPVAASGVYAGRTQYYKSTSSTQGSNEFGAFTVTASEGVEMQTGSAGTGAAHTHSASAASMSFDVKPRGLALAVWTRTA